MSLSKEAEKALAATVSGWFKNFAGTSALDVARDISIDHTEAMRIFEQLADADYGSLNRSVLLYQVSFDPDDISSGFKYEPVTTHIFFPSKETLRKEFFASELPQQKLPEYKARLYLGAHQIGLVFFLEQVLSRYLDHPEHYEINDSLAGGDISSLSAAPEDRYLYVRYGKCQLISGQIAVTAIYKDLSDMTPSEQRYWHSHEIDSPNFDRADSHFQNFLRRTYEGEFVDFHDPIATLLEALGRVNKAVGAGPLFTKLSNVHLRLPVEQTYKSYCDASSELYKILGPDSLSQSRLKALLLNDLGTPAGELMHAESERPLSTIQLFALLEQKLGASGVYTKPLRTVADLRIDADHKVLERDAATKSYSRDFAAMCDELVSALANLAELLERRPT
jgi:hypothetical protein